MVEVGKPFVQVHAMGIQIDFAHVALYLDCLDEFLRIEFRVGQCHIIHFHLSSEQRHEFYAHVQVLGIEHRVAILHSEHVTHLQIERELEPHTAHAHVHAHLLAELFACLIHRPALHWRQIHRYHQEHHQEQQAQQCPQHTFANPFPQAWLPLLVRTSFFWGSGRRRIFLIFCFCHFVLSVREDKKSTVLIVHTPFKFAKIRQIFKFTNSKTTNYLKISTKYRSIGE